MTIITVSRAATTDEISAEMDRRGAVIEQLETALRQRADEATRVERDRCKAIADAYQSKNRFKVSDTWRDDMSPSEVYETGAIDAAQWIKDEIAAAIRARAALAAEPASVDKL